MGSRDDKLLMSAEETAKIISISLKKLYKICKFFDEHENDPWDLIEGEHFEWVSKGLKTRRFHEAGALAIAKYIQETNSRSIFRGLMARVLERITHRQERATRLLVRRSVTSELKDLSTLVIQGNLVFVERRRVIRILGTNGKGLNAAALREQENCGLMGRETMEKGVHFNDIDNVQHWSQRGLVRIAQNMSENFLSRKSQKAWKSRKAWIDAVAEVVDEAITEQRKYLESSDERVKKAMAQVKSLANNTCQITRVKRTPDNPFDLHAHHLFDRSTRPDLATLHDNLLVIHEEVHEGFHNWHGGGCCEPKHFVDYLTSVESWRFDTSKKAAGLQKLINRLDKLQQNHENHLRMEG